MLDWVGQLLNSHFDETGGYNSVFLVRRKIN